MFSNIGNRGNWRKESPTLCRRRNRKGRPAKSCWWLTLWRSAFDANETAFRRQEIAQWLPAIAVVEEELGVRDEEARLRPGLEGAL